MQVFVAEAWSGLDVERLRPFRDALRSCGALLLDDPQSADAFVLPWTETAMDASHVQALAVDAWNARRRTGRPRLFWLPICSEPIPLGYRFYADGAIHLPRAFGQAARLICQSDDPAAPNQPRK